MGEEKRSGHFQLGEDWAPLFSGPSRIPLSLPVSLSLCAWLGFPALTSPGGDLSTVEAAGAGPRDARWRWEGRAGASLAPTSWWQPMGLATSYPTSPQAMKGSSLGQSLRARSAVERARLAGWHVPQRSCTASPARRPGAAHDMSQARWTGKRTDMLPEIAAAVGFLSSLLRTRGCVSEQRLKVFSGALQEALTGEPTPRSVALRHPGSAPPPCQGRFSAASPAGLPTRAAPRLGFPPAPGGPQAPIP